MTFRRASSATSQWLFGLAISLVLVALWGRAVAYDESTVGEAAAEAIRATLVTDAVADWLVGTGAAGAGDASGEIEPVVRTILSDPRSRATITALVHEVVVAAAAPPGETVVIDVRAHLTEAAPTLVATLSPGSLDWLTPLEIATGEGPVGTGLATTRAVINRALLAATALLAAAGAVSLALADDRRMMARALAARAALSALGFTVMMRVGAWALDADGGAVDATPSLRTAAATMVASNLWVPLAIGGAGAGIWLLLRRRRSGLPEPPPPPAAGSPPEPAKMVSIGQ